jgi:hypothetical protein
MPIVVHNPFKGRQYLGEVIILCVRWYLRYPLSYEHLSDLVASEASKWTPVAFGVGCRRMDPS